jgi:hypothetical protein
MPRSWVHQFTTRTCNLQVSSSLYPSLLPPLIAWSCSPLLTGCSGSRDILDVNQREKNIIAARLYCMEELQQILDIR